MAARPQGGLIYGKNTIGDQRPGVTLGGPPSPLTHLLAQAAVIQQTRQRRRHLCLVPGGSEQALDAIGYHLTEPVDGGRHHRPATGHRFQQDHPEGLLAGVGGAVDVGGSEIAGLIGFRNETAEVDVRDAFLLHPALVAAAKGTVAHHHQLAVRPHLTEQGVRVQQCAQPLALLQTTQEEDGLAGRAGDSRGRRHRGIEDFRIDSVGDDRVVSREVPGDEGLGRFRYSDATVEAAEESPQQRSAIVVTQVLAGIGVKGAHVDALPVGPQDGDGQGRHERLVEMNYVEALRFENLPDLSG